MSEKKKVVIGCAWTYANSDIHLGHICAYMGGDVLARYHRAVGNDVIFVSGTDCHGTPTTERAIREGITPTQIVERYHAQYTEVFKRLGFSYDLYTLTTTPYHHEKVKEMFLKLQENGLLYEKTESASYCPKCGKFVYDREVEVVCPKCGEVSKGDQCGSCDYVFQAEDLLKSKCRICGSQTEIRDNTNVYFKLSELEPKLREHFENNKKYWRKNTVNETQKFLEEGLHDRAVTRDLNWGVDVPLPGFEDKRIYVWVDAVWGYVSATQKYCEENGLDFRDYWYDHSDGSNLIYMCHGKDNIVFHTIIFPALLLGTKAGFFLPNVCVSSEFLNINGEKISKSKGNGWPMLDVLNKFDSDSVRYICIANGPEKRDTNFTFEDYHAIHNSEIVNKFGNFINRTLNYKGLDGFLPEGELDPDVAKKVADCYTETGENIYKGNFKDALSRVMQLVEEGNKYYDEEQPWVLARSDDKTAFNNVIFNCTYMIANLANLMDPFMPFCAEKLRNYLNLKPNAVWEPVTPVCGKQFGKIEPMFKRLMPTDVL